MLLPLLLATVALGGSPSSTVVVVTRRTAVTSADALALATLVTKQLEAAGAEVVPADAAARRLASMGVADTSACAGRMACVREFGRQLDVAAVAGLSVSELDRDRSLSLELVRVSDGAVLTRENFLFSRRGSPQPEQLSAFARRAVAALPARVAPAPPPAAAPVVAEVEPPVREPAPPPPGAQPAAPVTAEPAADAPVAAKLVPAPDPPRTELSQPQPTGPSHQAGLITGAGAVVALAGAAVLSALAFSAKSELSRGQLEGGYTKSPLTGSQALAVSARANAEFVAAGICGLLGVGLGATAVAVW